MTGQPNAGRRRRWARAARRHAESRVYAGQLPYLLTELLTRLVGTGETAWDADDARRADHQVSETHRDAGDGEDACRRAHNPATTGCPRTGQPARGPGHGNRLQLGLQFTRI